MKTALQRIVAAAALIALFSGAPALATEAPAPTTVITVYVNAHTGHGLAKDVNELHAKMEKQGWRFADMSIHMENGDTEGAWVTYTR